MAAALTAQLNGEGLLDQLFPPRRPVALQADEPSLLDQLFPLPAARPRAWPFSWRLAPALRHKPSEPSQSWV
jgi:hypothetical protein